MITPLEDDLHSSDALDNPGGAKKRVSKARFSVNMLDNRCLVKSGPSLICLMANPEHLEISDTMSYDHFGRGKENSKAW